MSVGIVVGLVGVLARNHNQLKNHNQMTYNHNEEKTWCVEDRPEQKILNQGTKAMTDTELIAVLLSGVDNPTKTARELYAKANNSLNTLWLMNPALIKSVPGIGPKKASMLQAAFELGNRKCNEGFKDLKAIKNSETVADVMRPLIGSLDHEEFWMITLNRANKVIDKFKVSQGGISGTVIDTRIILRKAIRDLASSIIVCHNHPSGNIQPSEADLKITAKLKKAGEQMEIKILDHVIIGSDKAYLSMADEGLL